VRLLVLSLVRDYDRLSYLAKWLSPEEKQRANRFLKEVDRKRFVLGRSVLRSVAAEYLGTGPSNVLFEYTSMGKPLLGNPLPGGRKPFEFNVAHSGDCVLIAWTEGKRVGVDVERLEPSEITLFQDVSSVAFSDMEQSVLSAAKPDEAAATFFRIWVRKEAVLKAEGCGITGSLHSFSVVLRHSGRTEWLDCVEVPDGGNRWRVVDLNPGPQHLGALAFPPGSTIQWLKPENVIRSPDEILSY
jgi:4'-phosphopantetheinyl transferase